MDGEQTVPEAVADELPPVCNTVTITVHTGGSMNIASDPPMDRWQLIGMLHTLLKAL